MREKRGNSLFFTAATMIMITALSLGFVTWVCQMAYQNTCIELEEQYLLNGTKDIVESVEGAIDYGKTLDNYYGMGEVLDNIKALSDRELKVVVLNADGKPMYFSFDDAQENVRLLAILTDESRIARMREVAEESVLMSAADVNMIVTPVREDGEKLCGYFVVCYDRDTLAEKPDSSLAEALLLTITFISLTLIVYLLFRARFHNGDPGKVIPIAIIMAGMVLYILFLLGVYRNGYNTLIGEKAKQSAEMIKGTVNSLIDKGLSEDELYRIDGYLAEKSETSESIRNIHIVKGSVDTSKNGRIFLPLESESDLSLSLDVEINNEYIASRIRVMVISFGAVLAVCLMLTYELMSLGGILSIRFSKWFNTPTPQQYEAISQQIRLISFLGYTAVYISLPYAAVVMRGWKASVFGLPEGISASLPLTVELMVVLAASALIQKIYKNAPPKNLMILVFPIMFLGSLACMRVDSPYLLIALRAFCGVGFAFMKYWLNTIVVNGSPDEETFSINCGRLNAGLLGGITVGASLGAIFAQSLGYQSNYLFTGVIFVVLLAGCIFSMPWKLISRAQNTEEEEGAGSAGGPLINKRMLLTLIFGCVPLNVGLMYVVSFVPSYMNNIGQDAIATSYVYLINGVAGIYLGLTVMKFLKKRSHFFASSLALFMAAGGMLLLLAGKHLAIVMLSAGIMGLFDGFGTPSITSYFTGQAGDKSDTARAMTVFNMAGSAVQIVCPMLYGLIIQPDGSTTGLLIFSIVFAVVACLFFLFCRPAVQKPAAEQ